MIEHYTDHAANERTFLAWVRTAIAVMAFGFLVERFDLFLQIAGQTLARRALSPTGQLAGNVVGLILIGLGAATIILALLRFRRTARQIVRSGCPARANGSTWPSPHCSSSSAPRFSSICLIRSSAAFSA